LERGQDAVVGNLGMMLRRKLDEASEMVAGGGAEDGVPGRTTGGGERTFEGTADIRSDSAVSGRAGMRRISSYGVAAVV